MNLIITIKNIQKSMLQLVEIYYFPILSLIIFIGIGMCICSGNINFIYAQTEDSSAEQKSEDNKDLTTIKVKMNTNNLNISNHDRLKIVGYLNGEGQTKYVNLNEMDNKDKLLSSSNTTEKSLTVNLDFNQSNVVSSVMVGDEYYICAYVLDDPKKPSKIATTDPISLFDCMEGTIGKSTSAGTITLFPTMKKHGESKAFYTTNSIAKDNNITTNGSKEVKITINVPIHDAKDIDDMNVVAMIKGDYKIKTIDVQKELEENNNKKDQILVPFTFNRQTEVGYIQPGDLFFGCATSDEFPGQNSKCEKRMLKDLDKTSKLCARKDSSC